jgi:hypothetical protein
MTLEKVLIFVAGAIVGWLLIRLLDAYHEIKRDSMPRSPEQLRKYWEKAAPELMELLPRGITPLKTKE